MLFTVIINIAAGDLQGLKSQGYQLCFSQPVVVNGQEHSGSGILASFSSTELSPTQTFSWQEEYQVFAEMETPMITTTTKPVTIGGNQTATIGAASTTVTGTAKGVALPFFAVNEAGQPGIPVRIGVSVRCGKTGLGVSSQETAETDGNAGFPVAFVSSEVAQGSSTSLLPSSRKLLIYFSSSSATGPPLPPYEIVVGTNTLLIVSYEDGSWSQDSAQSSVSRRASLGIDRFRAFFVVPYFLRRLFRSLF